MAKSLMLAAAALIGGQGAPVAEAPLAPSGKWVAQFEDNLCLLSRPFGADGNAVRFAIRAVPGDPSVSLYLLRPAPTAKRQREGSAELLLEPSGRRSTANFVESSAAVSGQRVARLSYPREDLALLAKTTAMTIDLGKDAPVRLRTDNLAGAMRTLATCEDDLVRHWGLDPAALRALVRKAEPAGNPAAWITDEDYPDEALQSGWEGEVGLRLIVDAAGGVKDCVITESSGHDVLDQQACTLIEHNGRFRPAIAADGKPVAALWSSHFTWRIPGG